MKTKILFAVIAALAAFAAHSVTPNPPGVVVSWQAPSSYTNGAKITDAITYNLYQATTAAGAVSATVPVQTNLRYLSAVVTKNVPVGSTQCFTAIAVVNGQLGLRTTAACTTIASSSSGTPPSNPPTGSAPLVPAAPINFKVSLLSAQPS